MTSKAKRIALACLAGVMVVTALVAAALPQLEFKAGVPLPLGLGSGRRPDVSAPPLMLDISLFWRAVAGVLLVASLLLLVYKLLTAKDWSWKEFFLSLLTVAVPLLLVAGIMLILSGVRLTAQPEAQPLMMPPVVLPEGPPLGPVSPGLLWLVALGLAAALAGLGAWLIFRPRRQPDFVKQEAERALEALKAGADLKNVILKAYWQMTQVLKQEQKLEMEAAMTTREFERLLGERGVPPAPVHQLTQLFEAVRYGRQTPGAEAEGQAVDCLTAIVRYSQAARPEP